MAEQGSTQYGGFWIRFLAYAVDGVILWIATVGLILACVFLGAVGAIVAAVIPLLLPLLYFALMQASARQATFGKALLGLKVGNAGGDRISFLRALGRELAKFISAIPLAIGFLIAAFTSRKQALHDFIASTLVVREGQSHVVAALAVVIVGYLGPVILVVFMGVGILAGVMAALGGSMLGGMMPEPAKQTAKPVPSAPAPTGAPATTAPAPAAPMAATAADVDKLLAPLTGLDKPGTTRAGPAVLELSTFFSGSDPKIWIRVHAPLAVPRAIVVVTQVADSANQSRYDPKSRFETEFFQNVQLSETRSGTPRMEGLRSVNLIPGTTEQQVQRIDGVLKFGVPVGVKTLKFGAADAGKAQEAGKLKLTLASFKGNTAHFSFSGPRDGIVEFRGFDAGGKQLQGAGSSTSGSDSGTLSLGYSAPVDRVEAMVASEIARREYPFTLSRSGGAAAVAAAPVAAKPAPAPAQAKPAPAPVPAKVAPPAPAKLAAVAPPAEVAPKPKPAPRKRAAAPKPPETQVTAASPVPAPVPRAAPVPTTIVAPRYSDLMTAVLNRDAAGVTELLQYGKWADKPDRRGTTPLMVAASLGDTASAEALLKAGADAGRALPVARERRDQVMLALLQRYGAR